MAQEAEAIMTEIIKSKNAVDLMKCYDNWSSNYDNNLGHPAVLATMQQFAELAAEFASNLNCRVIDICAGSGLSGAALQASGFTNIDAIDGSSGMLDVARSKKIYKNLYHELIGEDRIHSFPTASYQLAFAHGVFIPGHLGAAHLQPLAKAVTPGGHVIIKIRERWHETENTKEVLDEAQRMENEAIWVKVETREIPSSVLIESALAYVFRVL